jgi:hypothetical protein
VLLCELDDLRRGPLGRREIQRQETGRLRLLERAGAI